MVFYLFWRFLIYNLSASLLITLIRAEPLIGDKVTRAAKGRYSCVVSIAYKNENFHESMHICTGVLITNEFVLTAAHCIYGRLLDKIQLIVGSIDLLEGRKYEPSMWITYDQWAISKNISTESQYTKTNNAANDMAMIKLSEKVNSSVAKPASLSLQKNYQLYNKYVVLVGWGWKNKSFESTSRYLLKAKVKILPNEVCGNIVSRTSRKKTVISGKHLCSKGEPYAVLSHGDSGGPVMRWGNVVGISRGVCPTAATCDLPPEIINDYTFNIHTGIDLYREFIDDVMKNSPNTVIEFQMLT